jgi:16S rRNA (uracil1498-N3)-methyltransferase
VIVPEGSLAVGELDLREDEALYVRDVLRLDRGVDLRLVDGAGHEATVEIIEVTRRAVRVNVRRIETVKEEPGLQLTLIQCVSKGEKMDLVIRQATELGVRAIRPAVSERSVARREARLDRWRKSAEDANRVSGRSFRPQIGALAKLEDVLTAPRAPLALCLALEAEQSLGSHLSQCEIPDRAELLIGPEGGLSEGEVQNAIRAGFTAVHIGRNTLRTETAGPAVIAMLLYWARAIAW